MKRGVEVAISVANLRQFGVVIVDHWVGRKEFLQTRVVTDESQLNGSKEIKLPLPAQRHRHCHLA